MNKEKLQKLLENGEFIKRILPMETCEEVQEEFKKEGLELSLEEIEVLGKTINATLKKGGALSEEELENVSGGLNFSERDGITIDTMLLVSVVGIPILGVKWVAEKTVKSVKNSINKRRNKGK